MTARTQTPEGRSDATLALRIERAIRDGGLALTRTRLANGGGIAAFDEVGSRFNRIYGLGLEGACTPQGLRALLDFMEAQGATRPVVETSPAAHPSAEASLRALGLEITERLEVLTCRLDRQKEPAPAPHVPSEIRVQQVTGTDAATLRAFVELMHFGFNPEHTEFPHQSLQDGLRAAQNDGVDLFVAIQDGRQIGAAQAMTRDGITILYGASVLKAHRRHGAQTALVRARVARARERGSEWATVFCAPDSATFRNAGRLGFSRAYTRLQWRAPER